MRAGSAEYRRRRVRFLDGRFALALAFLSACSQSDGGHAQDDAPSSSERSDADEWAAMPSLGDSMYREFTSHDRSEAFLNDLLPPGNKDFNNFLAVCSRPEAFWQHSDDLPCDHDGYLIAADDGPGVLSRMFLTVGSLGVAGVISDLQDERIKIYIDGSAEPAYDGLISEWKAGTSPWFTDPLARWTSGALVSYRPIRYETKLRVYLDDLRSTSAYYYQVGLQSFDRVETAPDVAFASNVAREWHARPALHEKGDVWISEAVALRAGERRVVLERAGPATLTVLRIVAERATVESLDELEIRVTWDEAEHYALDLPLGSLFGLRHELSAFNTLPMTVDMDGRATNMVLALPMPFASSMSLELANVGTSTANLRVEAFGLGDVPSGAWGHFHATKTEQRAPFTDGERFYMADLRGRGKYVGTLAYLEGGADPSAVGPDPLNFLEGDHRTVVDGRVAGEGTGTEDFFDGGWYFQDGVFSAPFSSLVSIATDSTTNTGRVAMLRWHLLADAIRFDESFELSFELGANRPATASRYTSVAYYYLQAP